MADIAIWGGSSTFATGSTPFGFYDTDTEFQADADKVAKFCASRLGFPLMDVELDRWSGKMSSVQHGCMVTHHSTVCQMIVLSRIVALCRHG